MEQTQFIRNGKISNIFLKPTKPVMWKFLRNEYGIHEVFKHDNIFNMTYMIKKETFKTKVRVQLQRQQPFGTSIAYAYLEDVSERFEFIIKKIRNESKWYISCKAFKIISMLSVETGDDKLNLDGTIQEKWSSGPTLDFKLNNVINVGDEHDLIIENKKLHIRISDVVYNRVDATILNNEDFIFNGKSITDKVKIGHNYVSMWRGSNKSPTKYDLDGVNWSLDPTKQFVQSIIAEKGDVLALPKDIMGIVTTFL